MYEICKCDELIKYNIIHDLDSPIEQFICESCKNKLSDDEFINNLVKGE
jgi:predicted SprT family Zn-dependent metalloprotease